MHVNQDQKRKKKKKKSAVETGSHPPLRRWLQQQLNECGERHGRKVKETARKN